MHEALLVTPVRQILLLLLVEVYTVVALQKESQKSTNYLTKSSALVGPKFSVNFTPFLKMTLRFMATSISCCLGPSAT